jgi:ATP-binding cassette subfamily B protein
MIVVAHKLNTILGVDMIVVLAGGRVEACGTHESLLARSHTYRRLFEAQERALGWTLRNDSGEGTI